MLAEGFLEYQSLIRSSARTSQDLIEHSALLTEAVHSLAILRHSFLVRKLAQ